MNRATTSGLTPSLNARNNGVSVAAPTYSCTGIVLRKTKLGETDLIVTVLADDGSQKRLVAKGARKPGSTFASRLELFSECRMLCVKGKSLDIVSEARLLESHTTLRASLERSSAAAPCTELLAKVTQPDLPCVHLYDASSVGLSSLEHVAEQATPAITATMLIKTLAFAGFRPALRYCAACGEAVSLESGTVSFSAFEGGVLCAQCAHEFETVAEDAHVLSWLNYLLMSSYAEVEANSPDLTTSFALLHIIEALVRAHVGSGLKSLEFMFTSGIYG